MKGRLVCLSRSLAALILAAAAMGGVACSTSKQNTDLGNTPTIKQVFVESLSGNGLNVNDPAGATPSAGAIDGNDLTYGLSKNIGFCAFDGTCPTGLTCNPDFICVDSNGKQPGVTDAVLTADDSGDFPIIQVVFDTLLNGATATEFWCACTSISAVEKAAGATATCTGGKILSKDANCGDCPDNSTTTTRDESGECVDINGDGVSDGPDLDRNGVADLYPPLVSGVVTVACNSTPAFTWSNVDDHGFSDDVAQDGYYDPSGNQFVPVDVGFEGIGPRIYLTPNIVDDAQPSFPSDSDCNLTVSGLTDKSGATITSASAVTWHTAACQVIATDPAENATGLDATMVAEVDITFNTWLNDATADASVTVDDVTVAATPVAVPGTSAVDPSSDPTVVVFTPDAEFAAGKTYRVTVHGGTSSVKEAKYGKQCPAADKTFTFATAAAKPTLKSSLPK